MNCPYCATRLQVVNRHGIEIDWCPECKGVWLERGELDKIIDRATRDDDDDDRDRDRDRVRSHRDHDRDRYRDDEPRGPVYAKKKRKSMLSELFDF